MSDDAYRELRTDPNLGSVVEDHGPLTLDPASDPFEQLVISIVNQQLSTTAAETIRNRLFDRVEATPEGILAADETVLRDCGLSSQKVGYVRNAADAFQDGLSTESLHAMDDDEVIDALTEIRGVGVWTAKMFLIFVLAREDVFPVEDLGIRRGMEHVFGFDEDAVSRGEMRERAERWTPYRSYASLYLWRSVD
ncbi:DNA-3-methyladenine glycosylase 2 family protein [Haloferax mediterranei ATCC 33500]|uniref:3-methyladenine DNA glycosylase n=1 Tax=Haloferax mediterranei (strain ATCC 33500 / DSM 1411 / JCM 8866 / NBRC 14739 / NCIMB 2177 / R-4) TaxID=523841 RepID=I3R8E1_HALMT|nr:DNA-3-methyladenine glycosylase [Haloferax mediterranei]AFK20501.1 DNA-3-methyladenine glycosylase [Haloferax mediterranei ATCC 33500]AHZ23860.1 3-methyladenine DNA glycosylase [Haloferax mediterranei ATCC 33500]ELZ98284.1 DNA-3-methyladenine glycosylase [Haloferax mediterranei ATCC 33500]MDX5986743.1 DNA-3-methyladenine glycosylase [Haloferax mediterranei ATCC 33500]QCQ76067.1 DNA-3-methyladenine glycosylase 2 family protein [Haloferax mediterranei ATCC 33500]